MSIPRFAEGELEAGIQNEYRAVFHHNSTRLRCCRSVVYADVIDQAGPETARLKILSSDEFRPRKLVLSKVKGSKIAANVMV